MNHYTIAPVSGAINWNDIAWTYVENQMWGTDTDITMGAQICYSDAGFHVHLKAKEANIRAEEPIPYGMACQDSCMEFFFSPEEGDIRYFNIELAASGCTYIGLCRNRYDAARLSLESGGILQDLVINRTEDGWEAFYTFPMKFIHLFFPDCKLYPGKKLRANLYKCGDLTVQEHYIAWNPMNPDKPDYHLPEFFGEMTLG